MKRRLATCALLLCVFPFTYTHAAERLVQGGATHTAAGGQSGTLWLQGGFQDRQWGRWNFQPVVSVGWISGRGGEPGYENDVWLAGGGGRVRWRHDGGQVSRVFFEGQLLGASGRTQALSGPVQFATGVGWSKGPWEIMLRHISNASMEGANRGETMVLVGRRF